jgi:SunS family peptide S-glycosyltransferase
MENIELTIDRYRNQKYPTITCGILTLNEEKSIKRCLNSVYGLFDEIIILDSFSEDKTIQIIKSEFKNIKIIQKRWNNDFSHHRNIIIRESSSDWIFFIDADNIYKETEYNTMHDIVKLISFFNLKVTISPIIVEHDNSFTNDNRRLIPLNKNIYFEGKVHEEPVCDGELIEDICSSIEVYHDGYDFSKVDMEKKLKRNIELLESMLSEEYTNPKWPYFYARDLLNSNKDENLDIVKDNLIKAIDLYEKNYIYTRYKNETLSLLCKICLQRNEILDLNKYVDLLDKNSPNCIDVIYYRSIILMNQLEYKKNKLLDIMNNCLNDKNIKISYIDQNFNHVKTLLASIYISSNTFESVEKVYKSIENESMKNELLEKIKLIKLKAIEMERVLT